MGNRGEHIADEKTLSGLYQQMIDDWNQGDGQAYAALFTEDADYVILDGEHFKGRETIAFSHQSAFHTAFKGSTMRGQVKDIRFLSADIALLHVEGTLRIPGQAGRASEQASITTIVAIRQVGRWGITAFHSTRMEERPQP